MARANRMAPDDPRLMAAARATGADVPVCLDPRPRFMRGTGDILSDPLDLPRLDAVLVNPGVAVATKDVFAALGLEGARKAGASLPSWQIGEKARAALLAALADDRNDLEASAIRLAPMIADVLAELRRLPGCRLARMSGSGATCFALFDTRHVASAGAQKLRGGHPAWWVRATALAG
jgi:4-diphosphocytidyl-2-C-methyl-D-erythritol kinase